MFGACQPSGQESRMGSGRQPADAEQVARPRLDCPALHKVHLARHLSLPHYHVVLQVHLHRSPEAFRPGAGASPKGRLEAHAQVSRTAHTSTCAPAAPAQVEAVAQPRSAAYLGREQGDQGGDEALLGIHKEGHAVDQVCAGVHAHLQHAAASSPGLSALASNLQSGRRCCQPLGSCSAQPALPVPKAAGPARGRCSCAVWLYGSLLPDSSCRADLDMQGIGQLLQDGLLIKVLLCAPPCLVRVSDAQPQLLRQRPVRTLTGSRWSLCHSLPCAQGMLCVGCHTAGTSSPGPVQCLLVCHACRVGPLPVVGTSPLT